MNKTGHPMQMKMREVQGLLTKEDILKPHNLLTHINTKTKEKRCYQGQLNWPTLQDIGTIAKHKRNNI